ncbi:MULTISPECIES: hypothetical protein [Lysinibacillus]|uniref:Uncharacterized protein n=1 Tax=Lysinibacillus irui TaxID=2998077 RepID=A0AAJ5RKM0_9BACI|nr:MULTISPECIES: hypothetical protein [Lysinibacillus]WDV05013.1 hypothetical protein OU989_11840 [Lysinibacillus irui]
MFINRIFSLWFLLAFIVCSAFVLLANAPIQYVEKSTITMSRTSNNELLSYIQQYHFLISDIFNALCKESFSFQLDYGVLPSGKIELLVSLPEEMDIVAKKKMEEIMLNCIQKNDLNPISFQLTLKDLYEPAATESTRLSYNDVMANLFETMIDQNYGDFSVEHSITSESIQVMINLTEDKNAGMQKKAQQLAEDIIRQHRFDVQAFQIEVQNKIAIH